MYTTIFYYVFLFATLIFIIFWSNSFLSPNGVITLHKALKYTPHIMIALALLLIIARWLDGAIFSGTNILNYF